MNTIKVLDHGHIGLVEAWGGGLDGRLEAGIIEAAKMSTGKNFIGWSCWQCPACKVELENKQPHTSEPGVFCSNETEFVRIPRDEKLLRYLYENRHDTPFEMAGAIIEVQAPIMVFREWHRHRTQSYNELSARYTPLPDVNYMPTAERCLVVSATNKQAGKVAGAAELTHEKALAWLERLAEAYAFAQSVYEEGLALGVPKELARLPVPVGRYSRMRASANLRNWLAFLTLREAPNAQWEIRQFSNALHSILVGKFPRTLALFEEGSRRS